MLDLARKAAELVVARIDGLPGENAWDGEFRQVLVDQLMEKPPESGQPAEEVLEQVARDILPFTTRLDHPRCFGFIPSSPTWPGVLADFMAAGYNVNACTWLVASGPSQVELVVIDWFRQWLGYPERAGGVLTSGGSAASVNAFVAARENAGHPGQNNIDENGLEQVNRTILARVFWEDPAFLSSTSLKGIFALRLCIINHNTTWEDVQCFPI